MQSELFCPGWFNHYFKHVKPTEDNPSLLILDGHSTHTKSLYSIEEARKANVHVIAIPPHTSHKIQPIRSLDRSFMKAFKTYYNQECLVWQRNNPGKTINLRCIGSIFGNAHSRAATPTTAINGFKVSGNVPLNPFVFLEEEFNPSLATEIQTENTSSTLETTSCADSKAEKANNKSNERATESNESSLSLNSVDDSNKSPYVVQLPKINCTQKII